MTQQQVKRLRKIKCLAFDVDGVLTDGGVYFGGAINGPTNSTSIDQVRNDWRRVFNIRDGLGIILLHEQGYQTAFITLSRAMDIRLRAENLKIRHFFDFARDKGACFDELLQRSGLKADEIAFIGDDVIDLPVFKKCGLAAAPADAHPTVLKAAHVVTKSRGGHGAAREMCDLVLRYGAFAERANRVTAESKMNSNSSIALTK